MKRPRDAAPHRTNQSQDATATTTIAVTLPPQAIEAVARRAAEIVLAAIAPNVGGRWLTGAKAAATYLGCSPKRVYNRLHEIPHQRDGGRLMFHTAALDEWLRR